jgi:ankyrin repeat protein
MKRLIESHLISAIAHGLQAKIAKLCEEAFIFAAVSGDVEQLSALANDKDCTKYQTRIMHSAMYYAAVAGRVNVLRFFIDRYAVVDAQRDCDLCQLGSRSTICMGTPLHAAVWQDHEMAAKVLLEAGANPNTRIYKKCRNIQESDSQSILEWDTSPIHCAASKSNTTMIRILINHGADVNLLNQQGATPLHRSVEGNSLDATRVLLRHGSNPNSRHQGESPLSIAAQKGSIEIAELLISCGANLEDRAKGCTPIEHAAYNHQIEWVRRFVLQESSSLESKRKIPRKYLPELRGVCREEFVVNVESSDDTQVSALLNDSICRLDALGKACGFASAIKNNKENLVQLFLRHNVDLNGWCATEIPLFGNRIHCIGTPLHVAVAHKKHRLIRLLLSKGARVNPETDVENNPLEKCAYNNDFFNHCEYPYHTPLHLAAKVDDVEVLRLLLSRGAKVNVETVWGESPLYLSVLNGNTQAVRLLLSRGAKANPLYQGDPKDIQTCEQNLDPPLHAASRLNHVDIARVLLEAGANPFQKDDDMKKAIDIAIDKKHTNIIRLFRTHQNQNKK